MEATSSVSPVFMGQSYDQKHEQRDDTEKNFLLTVVHRSFQDSKFPSNPTVRCHYHR